MSNNTREAQAAYETAKRVLTNRNWSFNSHDEKLILTFGVQGEDIPMNLGIIIRPSASVLTIESIFPFKIKENKRVDAAVAAAIVNDRLIDGCFNLDVQDGTISFCVRTGYLGTVLSEELINRMLVLVISFTEEYNDKFLMLSTGVLSIQQFIEWELGSEK